MDACMELPGCCVHEGLEVGVHFFLPSWILVFIITIIIIFAVLSVTVVGLYLAFISPSWSFLNENINFFSYHSKDFFWKIKKSSTVINKSINNKCWWGCREKGIFVHCWWDCRRVQPLWKTVWNFLKKLKIELPFDSAIPLLGLYPKNPESPIQKNLCTPMFIAA